MAIDYKIVYKCESKEGAREFQEICLRNGIIWAAGSEEVQYLDQFEESKRNYLAVNQFKKMKKGLFEAKEFSDETVITDSLDDVRDFFGERKSLKEILMS